MTILLLIIIYLAFISLGLPDSVLGSAWPIMQKDLGASLDTAGYLYMIVAIGTIVSSLASGRILKRFGTGQVTLISCAMTAGALFGFHLAPSVLWLAIFAVPLGLGAGAVDAGLNNYVAVHFKAHHMNWLHSFWGVGATLGPVIMGRMIISSGKWNRGYLVISIIQAVLVLILLFSLPLWDKHGKQTSESADTAENPKPKKKNRTGGKSGLTLALTSFFFYCGAEATVGLWGSSFLANIKNMDPAQAAQLVSFYWGGITAGRFISGFIRFRLNNKQLIRLGQIIAFAGAVLLILPLPTQVTIVSFMLIGLGLAPVFPSMLHETPARFGKERSQYIMGIQMAIAYTGSTLLPPLLGTVASRTSLFIFPVVVLVYVSLMWLSSERLNSLISRKKAADRAAAQIQTDI
ncbi:MAG: MFS transporter [Clostridiaceae bacterium]|nr:MFS transporter [Clostridiaceae bacterium]